MRIIETQSRAIASLSAKAKNNVLLLKGPGESWVVVMSPQEFARQLLPKYVQAAKEFSSTGAPEESNVLDMRDYIAGLGQ